MEDTVQTYPFVVSFILARIPKVADHDIAVGMVGANDEIEEYLATPFPDGIDLVAAFSDEEPAYEEFWKKYVLPEDLSESVIADRYFELLKNENVLYFSEPFVVFESNLSAVLMTTLANLTEKSFCVSTTQRFERLLKD